MTTQTHRLEAGGAVSPLSVWRQIQRCKAGVVLLFLLVTAAVPALLAASPPGDGGTIPGEALPASWLRDWNDPPPECRPLQIVHGIDPRRAMPDGMTYYVDRGLGGVVCNVAFKEYMRSEESWKTLVAGIRECDRLGMVVWLYDEDGYPSGAAGGLVLEEDPAYEATALAFDPSRDPPFFLRPAYEHTHASNNYYASRRYANLIDDRAVQCFLKKTHEAYWDRLEPFFGNTIRATFTDEPSLIAVNIGQIPEPARGRVRVADPVDPNVRPLPCVPWCYDLPARYEERYGEDLLPHRRSLFQGSSAEDRRIRRQFWELVAELIAERYFGAIQQWCAEHGVASSGHTLSEESLIRHVPLEGNALKVLGKMDIPGLDMLTSDPEAGLHSGWLTAALPASAAAHAGRRRVMTEVSDFSQKMSGAGPSALAEMQATAAWQAAWGVTEFTLYYGPADRPADEYRAYCDFVGRLNAVLRDAGRAPEVLLYYPIRDLWAEYQPVAGPLTLESQSARARQMVGSFMTLGRTLQRSQVPFALVDHELLASAAADADGTLAIGNARYKALLLPKAVELPPEAQRVVDSFRRLGGRVIADGARDGKLPLEADYRISPPSYRIAVGRFARDGRDILLVVNVGRDGYVGQLAGDTSGSWLAMDPVSGDVRPCEKDPAGRIPLDLQGREAVLLVR